ncbi:MAG: hypothetical protein DSM107014_05710 [Gomphosphaeria aponina SAG 52.96 = DSM 107014]|uniref:Uncharacterized protein n=1 Tax=Gomphosphaeria aponina SAG 52.96 = DSM 107014 TaxID=1521640 RepID=A0A941GW17_9CHRO|nr:hypothetical protein [Gomphosphaeria aponina SAG 52.96 = DSM 107014]
MPNFLISLLLTTLVSFLAPVLLIGLILVSLAGISYIPGFAVAGQTGVSQIEGFLAVFGSGCPVQGIFTIGFTCAVVGALFDLYNFYRYQSLRGGLKSLGEES